MLKKLLCNWFNLIPQEEVDEVYKGFVDKIESKVKEMEVKAEVFETLKKENRSNYRRANRYYMRIKKAVEYLEENNIPKKHYKNIIDILDGAENDGFK